MYTAIEEANFRVMEKGVNDDFIKYTALNEFKESRTKLFFEEVMN